MSATEYHVATTGSDAAIGDASHPFKTISKAAAIAQAGDVITVHDGIYREWVSPARGGTSESERIVYQAAPEAEVIIKGSEVATGWERVSGDTWKVAVPNSTFGDFNPYSELVAGAWFRKVDQDCHLGAVYLDGHWLVEAASQEAVMEAVGEEALWFATVDDENTHILAQFNGVNPDGTPFRLTEDIFGVDRRKRVPHPGPFAQPEAGKQLIKVWPL